jgi:hypothetical protein
MNNNISVTTLEGIVGLSSQWVPGFSDRAFYFDAFLSHNSEDSFAQALAQSLRDLGVRVWFNESADMRSRRVVERITKALNNSRYIVVCVGPNFRDSPWVKAEYLNALRSEKEADGSRVILARPANNFSLAGVPEVLRGATCHSMADAADAASLARTLIDGNRLPAEAIRKHGQFPDRSADWSWLEQARDAIASDESSDLHLRRLAFALNDNPHKQALQVARSGIFHASFREVATALDARSAKFIFEAGKWFSLSTDTYERTNGLMILGQLDSLGRWPCARTILFEALARETDESVLREQCQWMPAIEDAELTQHLDALTHAALIEASPFFRSGPFARFRSALPEAVRMRVVVRDRLGHGVLGIVEQALLCFGRIDFLQSSESNESDYSALSTAIEISLRDFHALLTTIERAADTNDTIRVEEFFVLACESVADMWEGTRANEVRGLEGWVPDYLAVSLLWAGRHPHLMSRAQRAYIRICDAIQAIDGTCRLAADLRALLERFPYTCKRDLNEAMFTAISRVDGDCTT